MRPIKLKADSSILIVLMGSLGDVVRGLCLAPAIKQALPHSSITWLVEEACSAMPKELEGKYLDRVIVFERSSPIGGLLRLHQDLKRQKFDICIDLQRHFKSGFFSFLSGAPIRLGFSKKLSKEFNWLFSNRYIKFMPASTNKLDLYLEFLDLLNIKRPDTLDFGLGHFRASDLAAQFLDGVPRPIIGVVLGSSWESKDWPIEGIMGLVDRLIEQSNYSVILLGDSSAKALAQEVLAKFNSSRLSSCVGQTNIRQLCALIAKLSVVVGPDSGPAHIAAALDVPYVGLFGPTSPERTSPYNQYQNSIKTEIGCSPCYRRCCPGLDRLCMRLISVDKVMSQIVRMA